MTLAVTLPFSVPDLGATDADLMAQLRTGDREAFGELIERHKDALVGYLARLTADRSRAEDLAQETFLRLYRAAPRYREEGNLTAYLYRIATNLLRSEERRARRWLRLTPHLTAVQPDVPPSPQAETLRRETAEQLATAVAALPLHFRAPLVLYEIEGWSYRAISKALACSEGTVKSRLARARGRLRERLAPFWKSGAR